MDVTYRICSGFDGRQNCTDTTTFINKKNDPDNKNYFTFPSPSPTTEGHLSIIEVVEKDDNGNIVKQTESPGILCAGDYVVNRAPTVIYPNMAFLLDDFASLILTCHTANFGLMTKT